MSEKATAFKTLGQVEEENKISAEKAKKKAAAEALAKKKKLA